MSAPVNVRAALEAIAKTNADFATVADKDGIVRVGQSMLEQQAVELRKVCAATVALIEAAEEARQLLEMTLLIGDREPQPGSTGHKLRAALARIGGAA